MFTFNGFLHDGPRPFNQSNRMLDFLCTFGAADKLTSDFFNNFFQNLDDRILTDNLVLFVRLGDAILRHILSAVLVS